MTTVCATLPHTTLELTASERAELLALIPARFTYQRRFASGWQRISGSDLKGKARKFGGKYMRSQRTVFDALAFLGVPLVQIRGFRGAVSIWSASALADHFNVN